MRGEDFVHHVSAAPVVGGDLGREGRLDSQDVRHEKRERAGRVALQLRRAELVVRTEPRAEDGTVFRSGQQALVSRKAFRVKARNVHPHCRKDAACGRGETRSVEHRSEESRPSRLRRSGRGHAQVRG
jgi:hypothetical protein